MQISLRKESLIEISVRGDPPNVPIRATGQAEATGMIETLKPTS